MPSLFNAAGCSASPCVSAVADWLSILTFLLALPAAFGFLWVRFVHSPRKVVECAKRNPTLGRASRITKWLAPRAVCAEALANYDDNLPTGQVLGLLDLVTAWRVEEAAKYARLFLHSGHADVCDKALRVIMKAGGPVVLDSLLATLKPDAGRKILTLEALSGRVGELHDRHKFELLRVFGEENDARVQNAIAEIFRQCLPIPGTPIHDALVRAVPEARAAWAIQPLLESLRPSLTPDQIYTLLSSPAFGRNGILNPLAYLLANPEPGPAPAPPPLP